MQDANISRIIIIPLLSYFNKSGPEVNILDFIKTKLI